MLAMVLEKPGLPLVARDVPVPDPGPGRIRVRVHACGVCRTDLHIVDGELTDPKLPIIPGHEIVGMVDKLGEGVERFGIGDRVGIPWLGWTCGECHYCMTGRENSATTPASPATPSTAATLSIPSPTSDIAFHPRGLP